MDRSWLKLCLLGSLVIFILMILALFAISPIFCTSIGSLIYTLFLFILNESHDVHNAQEFENRFWTIFAILSSTAAIFLKDSPLAFGISYPSAGFISVLICGYGMHLYDRNLHRHRIGRLLDFRRGVATAKSLDKLIDMGIPIEDQLHQINVLLSGLDRYYLPSTFNNIVNKPSVLRTERKIVSIFEDAGPKALNYLIGHCQLALIFYKIKDHRSFNHQHRTQLLELLSIDRISQLSVYSKVVVLHALQMMKLPANTRAEYCVKNIITNTRQDDLSYLKTLTDAKGNYFCMTKLIYDDIKSEIVRENMLQHIDTQARVQLSHMAFRTKRSKYRKCKFWRKVLSDVDDTLTCSAGSYPSGIDKRYGKKVVYPGVLGFYRELDLGTDGPETWPDHTVGNLVFLSARPHVYKDMSEKINYAKFEKLINMGGMHTMPSLLAGDVNSGLETLVKNDFEPLAQKKFDNFKKYAAIYPEFRHVFICDNGQGDVRAAELMVEAFPTKIEAIYVHVVQKISSSYKYFPDNWKDKPVRPFFFKTYPEAALDAAKRNFIRTSGLRRICMDAINDFYMIQTKNWPSERHKLDRRDELNQALWSCNQYLKSKNEDPIALLDCERKWRDGEKVNTPFGIGTIISFDNIFDLYEVALDWRPISDQLLDFEKEEKKKQHAHISESSVELKTEPSERAKVLETVFEMDDEESNHSCLSQSIHVPIPTLTEEPVLAISTESKSSKVAAKIQGRCITKLKKPALPRFSKDDQDKKVFSFWASRGEHTKVKSKSKSPFSKGNKCSTPYGSGVVQGYREDSEIVILKMIGWTATAYLSTSVVKSEGFFESLFRKITSPEPKEQKKVSSHKDIANQITNDSVILTPFGEGHVIRSKINHSNDSLQKYPTIGISITSWTLANNFHPTLYCTEETAIDWKSTQQDDMSKSSGGILSAFLSLGKKLIQKKIPTEIQLPLYDRFYMDGAAVTSAFGHGRIENFREEDGFYEVSLIDWVLANGRYAKIYLTTGSLTYRKAPHCHEGYGVLTSYGLSGRLESVQPKTGVHIVTVPGAGMVCYLQPKEIICPLKAIVGDDVLTSYGNGRMLRYKIADGIYEITLRWGATLYARAEAFERESNFEYGSRFQMGWVFKLFFSKDNSSNVDASGSVRSRSNSLTSLRTQNSKSVLSLTG